MNQSGQQLLKKNAPRETHYTFIKQYHQMQELQM